MSFTEGMSKEQKFEFAKEMFAAMGFELVVAQGEKQDNKSNCEEGEQNEIH